MDDTHKAKRCIGEALEPLERAAARERQGYEAFSSGNLPEVKDNEKGNTLDKVASVVGMSRPTYEKAKAVVQAARERQLTDRPLVNLTIGRAVDKA